MAGLLQLRRVANRQCFPIFRCYPERLVSVPITGWQIGETLPVIVPGMTATSEPCLHYLSIVDANIGGAEEPDG